jgi:ribonuclease P protein component
MEKGRVAHSPLFILRTLAVPGDTSRLAAVSPTKVTRKASDRNRLRRQMYEAMQPLVDHLKEGLHVIAVAKAQAVNADFPAIVLGMRDVFVKAGILK